MKKIFYYTDVLPLLSKEREALDKLKRNLALFKEHAEDISLVWHPWSKTMDYLKLNNSSVTKDYQNILEQYQLDGWGILDESDTFDNTRNVMLTCNAYYGDISNLIYDAKDAGLPVMIQNIEV